MSTLYVVTEDGYDNETHVVGVYDTWTKCLSAIEAARSTPVTYVGGVQGLSRRSFTFTTVGLNAPLL